MHFKGILHLIALWQIFGDSPTDANPTSDRYVYPALPFERLRQSSLIQSRKFSERPRIVPPEVFSPLRS